jgi:hypothetical protein
LKNLLAIKEYPSDMQDVMTLYAEGYTLADLLVQEGGRSRYLKFLSDAHRDGWDKAIHAHYGYRGVADLEQRWHGWVIAGCPEIELPKGQMLAAKDNAKGPKSTNPGEMIVRGQSPNEDPFLSEKAVALGVAAAPGARNKPKTPASRSLSLPLAEKKTLPVEVAMARNDSAGNHRNRNEVPDERKVLADERLDDWIVADSSDRDELQNADDDADDTVDDDAAEDESEEAAPVPPPSPASRSVPRRADVSPQHNSPADRTLAARNRAPHRQTTEWSEFPHDPRPSPLLLPASRR